MCVSVCVCVRSEEHTSELQSHLNLVCRLLLEKRRAHVWSGVARESRMPASPGNEVHATHQPLARICPCSPRRCLSSFHPCALLFFFLMIRRPPRSTLFPTRRSSDLMQTHSHIWTHTHSCTRTDTRTRTHT